MFLNSSRVSTWNLCRRKFFWENEFEGTGLRPDSAASYFATGIAVHDGLAALYSGTTQDEAANRSANRYIKEVRTWDGLLTDEWNEGAAYAAKMVNCYAESKEPVDDFKVVEVEQEFVVPLGELCWSCGHPYNFNNFNPKDPKLACSSCGKTVHYWVGRTDMDLVRHGHLAIMDHKTTAYTPSDEFLAKFSNSFQLLGYVYGRGKSAGYNIEQFGVNVLQKAVTLGEVAATHKQCPSCRNGKKKKLACGTCSGTGKVLKDVPLSPFRRRFFPVIPSDIDRFVLTMHSAVQDIERERERFKTEPELAFPMNDKACNIGKGGVQDEGVLLDRGGCCQVVDP